MPLLRLSAAAACCGLAAAADWHVAPGGSDAAPGSFAQPFASVQRAHDAAAPGDTVFIRGGTYHLSESGIAGRRGQFARIIDLHRSGEPGRPITYRPWQQDRPVFDCSQVKPAGMRVTAFSVRGSWLHIRGLEVTGVQVTIRRHTQSICFESNGSHNILENLSMHDGQAIGIYHLRGSNNLFLNCDAWNNRDHTSEDGRGGNVDGFGCHPDRGSAGNVFRGCRAWFNSDDGYDCLGAAEAVIFENCWALYNGFTPKFERMADGNGFKAGGYAGAPAEDLPHPVPRHTVRNCVAAGNKNSGFYANHHPGGCDWTGNSAFRNGINFNLLNRLADNRTDVDGYGHRLQNNLSHGTRRHVENIDPAACTLNGNSFLPGVPLTDADFVSTDEQQLLRPRPADGGLPEAGFLRPRRNSAARHIGAFRPQENPAPPEPSGTRRAASAEEAEKHAEAKLP